MDKKQLDSILKNAYNPPLWRQVLTDVFGARNLNQTPQPIMLSSNSKDMAESAFELGFFNTSDDRIIGLYQINLTDKPQIWRNRVGLRELLRNIYKHDVDGALVVFIQNDKWRLSFISEIRVLNDDGTIERQATEPKRYTYLLGKNEKTKTPTDRLSLLINKRIALEDIRAAFSVEALNNEFYKQISGYFYELVGATTTKGRKTTVHERVMKLPSVADSDRTAYQNFAVRLIGRTVFCWFLKVKKSKSGEPLLPEKLLSSESVRSHKNYYHEILEPLFFQTLNTPMPERIEDLPKGCDTVPFLNGGLFEPKREEDFYDVESKTGNYQSYELKIPDSWFESFFQTLEQYNFTIDENSPTDVEISVDPEMLGRIFENLLAEIDPDSGETARKATGSFYTPREIVNYMVDESLIVYLKSELQRKTVGYQSLKTPQATLGGNDWRTGQAHLEYALSENRWQGKDKELEETLRRLFSYAEPENPFDDNETEKLIKSIDDLKILDPACGSGAFPMGVLHRLVFLLGKLDRKNEKWKTAQIAKIDGLIKNANDIENYQIRKKITDDLSRRKAEIEQDFPNKEFDFWRKLFLIENCIYGVDIQPIAAEISKLRCFLTLIVDEDVSDNLKDNRGVKPLPNLEFKFVTADALLKLPTGGLFQATTDRQLAELEKIRHEYINSYGETKEAAKRHFQKIQDEIEVEQTKHNYADRDKRAMALTWWKPFSHEKVDWFDPLWMFGVKDFDIVIGNPPYVRADSGEKHLEYRKKIKESGHFETLWEKWDLYIAFIELGYKLLKQDGVTTMIVSDAYCHSKYAQKSQEWFLKNSKILTIDFLSDIKVFDAAVRNVTYFFQKADGRNNKPSRRVHKHSFGTVEVLPTDFQSNLTYRLFFPEDTELQNISVPTVLLKDIFYVSKGMVVHANEKIAKGAFELSDLVAERKDATHLKPFVEGKYLSRWIPLKNKWLEWGTKRAPAMFSRPTFIEMYEVNEKLISVDMSAGSGQLKVCYDNQKLLHNHSAWSFIIWNNLRDVRNNSLKKVARYRNEKFRSDLPRREELERLSENFEIKFLLSVMNSKFAYNFLRANRRSNIHLYPDDWKTLPIPKISKEKQKPFENLVDYILFLKELDNSEQVNEFVPNSHLVEQFEEVIDALVYELYFEENFRRASIAFLKYAETDFPPVEGKAPEEKIKTIHEAYQRLRQKDNPIRNNLKLMDIRLADLIMPIKTAR